jgi:pyruvate dehydrogenase (quinone)
LILSPGKTTSHRRKKPKTGDAVISLDCGANVHFAARCLCLRANQRFTGTGMLASMAPGVSFAIAGRLAYPDRQSVAVVGDDGFAMLRAEHLDRR